MELLAQWWDRIVAGFSRSQPPELTLTELLIILLAAAALSIPKATWRYFGLFSTVVHELGHAFAALMTGSRVTGIRLNFDHSGLTTSLGRPGWRTAWATFWGYPVPAVVGAVLVWAGCAGWAPAALSVGALVLLLSLLFIRNAGGVLILLGAVAVSTVLVVAVPAEFSGHAVVALGVALLVGSVRDLGKVVSVHARRRRDRGQSDAYLLYRSTGILTAVWLALFAVVIAGSLAWAWLVVSATGRLAISL
ncbi:M50 family metallopeptidase [Arthrobacter sp. EH-1B-1]|uniref:M50 family metallopeptidase n=1 Tax=Arthrobacter vasquezii TaxID=2977629 RepID=A0ABT6CVP2_9MICC|nr:M50 family metallopeptidase [Arthrobacter vasquezii]MDF9278141.1 M50 family metallopeptidase [Arthrobacter vasquezii]